MALSSTEQANETRWVSCRILVRNRAAGANRFQKSSACGFLCNTRAASTVHDPKDQAEQQAQEQTCHQREIERHIIPLDHDVARQVSQPDPTQIGPEHADYQYRKAEHDQKARHRYRSAEYAGFTLVVLSGESVVCNDECQIRRRVRLRPFLDLGSVPS
jgi:hypothetical protein